MSAFSPRQMFVLDLACQPLWQAFDGGVYHVGTSAERGEYRDVDVRLILEDDRYDQLAQTIGLQAVYFLGLAIGQYLASMTGMPIDFQIQRTTEANARHGGKMRNPLGLRTLDNFKGDASPEA